MMSRQSHSSDDAIRARRHAIVTSLQILTLTAELLALDLRDENRTSEQLEARSRALWSALKRVVVDGNRLSELLPNPSEAGRGSATGDEQLKLLRGLVGVIMQHVGLPDVERDVLAEYVDDLHERAIAMIGVIDAPPGR